MTPRCTRPADAPGIAEIERVASPSPWSLSSVQSHLGLETGCNWVLETTQGVVAHLLTRVVADEAEVLSLAVHPDARRMGLARGLMACAHREWAARGVQRAFLEVRHGNVAARTLYTGLGWVEQSVRNHYYSDGEDAVVMQVSLC